MNNKKPLKSKFHRKVTVSFEPDTVFRLSLPDSSFIRGGSLKSGPLSAKESTHKYVKTNLLFFSSLSFPRPGALTPPHPLRLSWRSRGLPDKRYACHRPTREMPKGATTAQRCGPPMGGFLGRMWGRVDRGLQLVSGFLL